MPPAHAQEIPTNLQAAIFFKVLSYDGSLAKKSGSGITIYLVTDKKTAGKKNSLMQGFKMLVGKQLGGKALTVKLIDISKFSSIASDASILYVAAGTDAKTASKVLSFAETKKVPTLGGSERLAQAGFAVGLTIGAQGKPQILINLPAAKKQGMKLSSRVLGLAKIIK